MYERKDGDGVLFKNEKTKDSQPDYTGNIQIDGEECRLAAWLKDGRKGKFMSLKLTLPERQDGPENRSSGQQTNKPADWPDDGDSIPF